MEKLITRSLIIMSLVFSIAADAQNQYRSQKTSIWAEAWKGDLLQNKLGLSEGVQAAVIQIYQRLNFEPQFVFWEDQNKINNLLRVPEMVKSHGLDPRAYHIQKAINTENDEARELKVVVELIYMALDMSIGRIDPSTLGKNIKYKQKIGLDISRIDALAKLIQNPTQENLDALAPRYEDYINLQKQLASGKLSTSQKDKVVLSMEKFRWLPDIPPQGNRFLLVNTAGNIMKNLDYTLSSFSPIREQRIITGNQRKDRLTPTMPDKITNVILNPEWVVAPFQNIWTDKVNALKGMYASGGVAAIREYLANGRFDLVRAVGVGADKSTIYDPADIDWVNLGTAVYNGPSFTFRQRPWDGNAVGTIKFSLDGPGRDLLIYLHDTGSRHLFNNDDRHLSSGCIRVHKYSDLAEYLLRDKGLTAQNIEDTISQPEELRKEQYYALDKNIGVLPVYTLHLTAQQDRLGKMVYSDDVYNEDAALKRALQKIGYTW